MTYEKDLLALIEERQALKNRLELLVFGAPEIREKGENKYIYVNLREDGRKISRYVGEYSEEMFNLILKNNELAKNIKKRLKEIEGELDEENEKMGVISDKVKNAIDFARKNLAESINGQARLEGIATTLAETEDVINGLRVKGISGEEARKIINMKHAWDFILNENVASCESDFGLLCQINKLTLETFFYNAGKIRSVPVRIGGTKWTPELPVESVIKEELAQILDNHRKTVEVAIDLLLYVMRKQIFIDGNKRTAVIFANHYLISRGAGVIFIDENKTEEYKRLLAPYYETGVKTEISKFLMGCFVEI